VDPQAVLVDQLVLHQRLGELAAAVDLELVAGLALQLGDLVDDVPAQQRGVGPLQPVQGRGGDVLGQLVEPGGDRVGLVGDLRPEAGEDLVGAAPQQEGVGRGDPVDHQSAHVVVGVGELPAALAELVAGVLLCTSRVLHDAVQRQEGGQRQPHACSAWFRAGR
jgi:hypothetical protein